MDELVQSLNFNVGINDDDKGEGQGVEDRGGVEGVSVMTVGSRLIALKRRWRGGRTCVIDTAFWRGNDLLPW